ncbi:MAG: ABC transporter permease [Planctomycetes bacterium]|nr:ABC transporter permease [Planctomycetota bacterium]
MLGPIFNREFLTVPRREKHHVGRIAALSLLWVIGLTAWQATVGFNRTATLGETARFGLLFFQIITYVELTLLLFFSALSAASTVSQEKDRRTFILLLLTDMRDHEIVVGKMLGSLLPIFMLLLTTLPVLAMTLLLGGVSAEQVTQAALILLATSFAAGSLGGLIALWRDKTFQALALSVLALVLYLCLVQAIGLIGGRGSSNWSVLQAWFDPFIALQYVLEPPSDAGFLAPAYGFTLVMLGIGALLNGIGIWKLRHWNPSGEPIMQREAPSDAEINQQARLQAHAAPGKARQVWENPILWREIRTYAYGRRPLLVKAAYAVVLFLICWFTLGELNRSGGRQPFIAAYGLVPVAILSLLLVSAQAVTSITSERDGKALDLLLVTDLSPREFIFGKLGGILWNTKEFLIPPLLLTIYYAARGLLAGSATGFSSNLGPLACILGALIVLLAFAMVLGLHVALRVENSRLSVAHTLGTIFFLSVGTLISIYLIIINGGSLANQLLSFSAFICLGIGGLWWVLSADRPSPALTLSATICPLAMFYSVVNILIGNPGTNESADPLVPFLVIGAAFGFTIAAMLVPLLSEFDVALGRTTANDE